MTTVASGAKHKSAALTSVANGVSDTMVNARLSDIQAAATAINVHKSPQETSAYVACGNIPTAATVAAPAPAAAPAGAPSATPGAPAPAPVTPAAAPATAPSAGATPVATPAAAPAPAVQPARPPAQLPKTGESGFALYGLLALGVLLLVAGTGLMIRRRLL
jgi:LPXTG-motif cell wall-anchored protein